MDLSLTFIRMARHLLPVVTSAICATRAWFRGMWPKWSAREGEMSTNSDEFVSVTSFCPVYSHLFSRYQTAMQCWAKRREVVSRTGPPGKGSGSALLRLETEFANAYVALHQHRCECSLCSSTRKVNPTYAKQGGCANSCPVQTE